MFITHEASLDSIRYAIAAEIEISSDFDTEDPVPTNADLLARTVLEELGLKQSVMGLGKRITSEGKAEEIKVAKPKVARKVQRRQAVASVVDSPVVAEYATSQDETARADVHLENIAADSAPIQPELTPERRPTGCPSAAITCSCTHTSRGGCFNVQSWKWVR